MTQPLAPPAPSWPRPSVGKACGQTLQEPQRPSGGNVPTARSGVVREYLLQPMPPDFTRPKDELGDLPAIRKIIIQVAAKHGISLVDILSERRARRFSWARQEVYWRASKETLASLPLIARATRRADHTTILHGIRAYEKRLGGVSGAA